MYLRNRFIVYGSDFYQARASLEKSDPSGHSFEAQTGCFQLNYDRTGDNDILG